MPEPTRERLQVYVAGGISLLWGFSALLAVWDGSTLLKVVTPIATLCFGWLFAQRAAAAG